MSAWAGPLEDGRSSGHRTPGHPRNRQAPSPQASLGAGDGSPQRKRPFTRRRESAANKSGFHEASGTTTFLESSRMCTQGRPPQRRAGTRSAVRESRRPGRGHRAQAGVANAAGPSGSPGGKGPRDARGAASSSLRSDPGSAARGATRLWAHRAQAVPGAESCSPGSDHPWGKAPWARTRATPSPGRRRGSPSCSASPSSHFPSQRVCPPGRRPRGTQGPRVRPCCCS